MTAFEPLVDPSKKSPSGVFVGDGMFISIMGVQGESVGGRPYADGPIVPGYMTMWLAQQYTTLCDSGSRIQLWWEVTIDKDVRLLVDQSRISFTSLRAMSLRLWSFDDGITFLGRHIYFTRITGYKRPSISRKK